MAIHIRRREFIATLGGVAAWSRPSRLHLQPLSEELRTYRVPVE